MGVSAPDVNLRSFISARIMGLVDFRELKMVIYRGTKHISKGVGSLPCQSMQERNPIEQRM